MIKNTGVFISLIVLLAACGKVTYRKTAGGMPYKLYKGTDTQKIYQGNIVKYHVKYVVKSSGKDSVYFNSFGRLPVYAPVSYDPQPYDIGEVWTKLHVGDSIVTTQMIDTFLKRNPEMAANGSFKKGDRLISYIRILDVFVADSMQTADQTMETRKYLEGESDFIGKYLASKNIKAEKTPSGAWIEIISRGSGTPADSGKFVSVNYTGTTFSGKKFDSNTDTSFHHKEPISFVVGGPGMIKGFDEAVKMMKVGDSVRVYVPSLLGYGGNPDPRSGIKPYEHIIFDLVLLDVKDKAPETVPQRRQPKIDPTQH